MKKKNKYDRQHLQNLLNIERQVDAIYMAAAKESAQITSLVEGSNLRSTTFSFDDYIITRKKFKRLLERLNDGIFGIIINGVHSEWTLANNKNNELCRQVFGNALPHLSKAQQRRYFSTNPKAEEAFLQRKESGLKLSERVWNYSNLFKREIELGVDLGIRGGLSADEMSRDLKQYLRHPDMLFRRVKNERGELVLSKNAAAYHPGRGVYRSSYKNALRLAATECNMAYRTADYLRWQDEDFVVGIRIQTSQTNHPIKDICDELEGNYPKDFKFTGWHPWCRCYATPILKTKEEIIADNQRIIDGKPISDKSVNTVEDVPEKFKEWVRVNESKMLYANTSPYFIRDNAHVIDEIINSSHKELSIFEKAKLRHDARTPEQEEAIKNAWEERKHKHALIKKTAENVLNVAKDYGEIDYSELQSAIDAGDLTKMQELSKTVAHHVSAMKKQEAAISDLIPDAHQWHKQYTMKELINTYTSVETKLNKIAGETLAEQKKWLENEIIYVEDPTKFKPHTIYPTYKVAQDAYAKKLESVLYQIDVNQINSQLSVVEAWSAAHPKSLNVANLLADAKTAIANGESIASIKQKASLTIVEHQKRLAEQARRDRKKLGSKSIPTSFDPDDYTQEAKDKAIWCERVSASHKNWDADSEAAWNSATTGEQEAWREYTDGSGHMNRPLRGYQGSWSKSNYKGVGNVPLDYEGGEQHIRDMYNLCERTRFDTNRWLQRGIETWDGVEGFFGIRGITRAQLRSMVGQEVCDYAFMSCGSAKGSGFGGLILNIYCPKGTKGFYACPHSSFGDLENESILQAGTKFRILKVAAPDYGTVYVDIEVIGYVEHPLLK